MIQSNDKDLLIQMMRTPGWSIYTDLMEEEINNIREQAGQLKVGNEDRLWLLARADGLKQALTIFKQWLKN